MSDQKALTKKDFDEGCKQLRRAVRDTLNNKKKKNKTKKAKTTKKSKKTTPKLQRTPKTIKKTPLKKGEPFKKVVTFMAKTNKKR